MNVATDVALVSFCVMYGVVIIENADNKIIMFDFSVVVSMAAPSHEPAAPLSTANRKRWSLRL